MTRRTEHWLVIASIACACAAFAATSHAAGGAGGGGGSIDPPSAQASPAKIALRHYKAGLAQRDKAVQYEQKAREQEGQKKREKLLAKATKKYRSAIRSYRSALQRNDQLVPAYNDLGYALRKTGDYAGALEAYDRALELEPGFAQAIEYRAEAYLGLGRLDDAKQEYDRLEPAVPELAGQLLVAMQGWVEAQRTLESDAHRDTEHFAQWVATRRVTRGGSGQSAPADSRW